MVTEQKLEDQVNASKRREWMAELIVELITRELEKQDQAVEKANNNLRDAAQTKAKDSITNKEVTTDTAI